MCSKVLWEADGSGPDISYGNIAIIYLKYFSIPIDAEPSGWNVVSVLRNFRFFTLLDTQIPKVNFGFSQYIIIHFAINVG